MKKIANHVSPQMHKEVDKYIEDSTQTHTQVVRANNAMLLARRLLQDLPMVPTNERIFELAQEIEIGLFDDLGPLEEAEKNWQAWKDRTVEILKAQKILIAAVQGSNEDVDYYTEAENFIKSIKELEPHVIYTKVLDKVYSYAYSNKEYAVALLETAKKYKILDEIDIEELLMTIGVDPSNLVK
jgi:hypothetical protein